MKEYVECMDWYPLHPNHADTVQPQNSLFPFMPNAEQACYNNFLF